MPPARPRDDVRSQIFNHPKDRVASIVPVSKSKKPAVNGINSGLSNSKTAATTLLAKSIDATPSGPGPASTTSAGGASTIQTEIPHVDWSSLPVNALHAYRSAYRLQIPASYTKPHAEHLYKSCDVALRAPSQCLARKKAHDLKLYRKREAQAEAARAQLNGISKSKTRTKDRRKSKKEGDTDSVMEEPPSPKSHPSLQDSASVQEISDNASRQSPAVSGQEQSQQDWAERAPSIPTSLYQPDPTLTVMGSLPVTNLATSIRNHFNAQQVNEAETLARFAYIARQQGSTVIPRVTPLNSRSGPLPLPTTTAEKIALVAENAHKAAVLAAANGLPIIAATNAIQPPPAPQVSDKAKAVAHSNHSRAAPRVLGGNNIETIGSYGDGHGWIMSTTSSGRQARIDDGASSTTFRLRFRP